MWGPCLGLAAPPQRRAISRATETYAVSDQVFQETSVLARGQRAGRGHQAASLSPRHPLLPACVDFLAPRCQGHRGWCSGIFAALSPAHSRSLLTAPPERPIHTLARPVLHKQNPRPVSNSTVPQGFLTAPHVTPTPPPHIDLPGLPCGWHRQSTPHKQIRAFPLSWEEPQGPRLSSGSYVKKEIQFPFPAKETRLTRNPANYH